MTEAISQFLANVFQGNVFLATIIIAIIPLIELKGAIPFGMSREFWGVHVLNSWQAFGASILGGVIVTAILALVFKPIYEAIKDKKFFKTIVEFFTSSASQKKEEIESDTLKTSGNKKLWIKLAGVFLFVSIPVPGTGVYTGTILAVFLGLNYWQTLITVTLGNILAGLIVMFICTLFPDFTLIILCLFLALIALFLIYRLIVHFAKKKKEDQNI